MGVWIAFTISTLIYVVGAIDIDPFNEITDDLQPSNITYDIRNARRLFIQFVKENNKEYVTDEEHERRYKIFVNNLVEINERNRRSQSEIHGITIFADLTREEFVAQYTGFVYSGRRSSYENESIAVDELLTNVGAPEEFDWRQQGVVNGIKDQMHCMSCWDFSAVAITESQFAIKQSSLLSLSEQQLLDCWNESGGCQHGNYPHVGLNAAAQLGGFMQSSEYPYQGQQGTCKFDKGRVAVRVNRGYTIDVGDEEKLKQLLYQYGPLSIAIYASDSFSSYSGRVFAPNDCPNGANPNHAVVFVGYGVENSVPYWIVKNSYGQNWGEQGYMKFIRGKRACSLLQYVAGVEVA